MTRLVSILFALLLSLETSAATITGNKLSDWCESSETHEELQCYSYITGVLDSAGLSTARYDFFQSYIEEEGLDGTYHTNYLQSPCVPEGVTMGQIFKVVIRYMDEHPEDLHQNGAALVMAAVSSTWRCDHLFDDAE